MIAELIDTHAHLDDEKFHDDLPEVLNRAKGAGVCRVVIVATTASSSTTCVALAERFPQLAATVGIQPNHVAQAAAADWDAVVRLARHANVVALGETGLDRYWDYTPFSQQEDYFGRHLALARELGRAVVIHCREAEADVVRMLRDDFDRHGPLRAVMHSFTGSAAVAEACVNMGCFISFAGMLTYKNAEDLRQTAKTIPLDRLLVETDSPYLAPVPMRGKRNEPGFVVHTASCLAAIKETTLADIANHSTRNARQIFALNQ